MKTFKSIFRKMKQFKSYLIFFLFVVSLNNTFAQKRAFPFANFEDSLMILSNVMLNAPNDFMKFEASTNFKELFIRALEYDKSYDFPFDSLKTISILKSADDYIRIITWNVRKNDGTFEHFGLLQTYNPKYKNYIVFDLTDASETIDNPEQKITTHDNWFGATYYKIIYTKDDDRRFYTLLGYNGRNPLISKKVIDVITLSTTGKPSFGAPIFKKEKKYTKRVVFQYSSKVLMNMTYDKQFTKKGKEKAQMIIFDRLYPTSFQLTGEYQFYYPEMNVDDGYVFKAGKWEFVEDIDPRNPKIKNKKEKKKITFDLKK